MGRQKPSPIVLSNVEAPREVQPWERVLLEPIVREFIQREFEPGPAAARRRKIRATWSDDERRFRDVCRRLGIRIERRRAAEDGSVVFTCRVAGRPKERG